MFKNPTDGLIVYQNGMERGLWIYDIAVNDWVKLARITDIPTEVGTNTGGAIIPYASGLPVTLTTKIDGTSEHPALVGFGASTQGPEFSLVDGSLELSATGNMAFSNPRNGKLTDISVFFSATEEIPLVGVSLTLHAQLYVSDDENNNNYNIFIPVEQAKVSFQPLTGTVPVGKTIKMNMVEQDIALQASKRYLLVFSATTNGTDLKQTIKGYVSGGVNIN